MMNPVRAIEIRQEIADSFGRVNKIEINLGAKSTMEMTNKSTREVVDIGPNAFWEVKELLDLEGVQKIHIEIEQNHSVLVTTTRCITKEDAISILKTIQKHRKDKI